MSSGTILVTGGAGYIGAHACKALSRAGYTPVSIDDLSAGHKRFARWGPLVEADIRDTEAVGRILREHNVYAVMHFAGSAYVGESVTDPQKYYENNVGGTLSLLRGMSEAGCTKIIFSSTCAVYGEPDGGILRESSPKAPVNPYGASKLMVERILEDYASAYGLGFITLRYFNACGADPEGEIGELRDRETHLIPRAMMAVQGHIDDFSIFGTDYPTPDGTAIRDYVHVCDLADAHVMSVQRLLAGGANGAFNLGTGRGHSVKQVLDAIGVETGVPVPVKRAPRRPGDPAMLVADTSEAARELGFVPKLSDIGTIVATAWAWHSRALTEPAIGVL